MHPKYYLFDIGIVNALSGRTAPSSVRGTTAYGILFEQYKAITMKCAICRNGYTVDGHITVVLERGPSTLVIKHVPANVCDTCGEEYLSEEFNRELLKKAKEAADRGVDLELLRFAA